MLSSSPQCDLRHTVIFSIFCEKCGACMHTCTSKTRYFSGVAKTVYLFAELDGAKFLPSGLSSPSKNVKKFD